MKKGNIIVAAMALCIAAMTAIAFKTNSTTVDLYYFNTDKKCVAAPCETINNSNKVCLVKVYIDSNCQKDYTGKIWVTDGSQ